MSHENINSIIFNDWGGVNQLLSCPHDYSFCIDFDETLIRTSIANNLAYQEAIRKYLPNFSIPKNLRFTRHHLSQLQSSLSSEHFLDIIRIKEAVFYKYISFTQPNFALIKLLQIKSNSHQIYLLSQASCQRIDKILCHYELAYLFTKIECHVSHSDKYRFFLDQTGLDGKNLCIFEDDIHQIQFAKQASIPNQNIFHVISQ